MNLTKRFVFLLTGLLFTFVFTAPAFSGPVLTFGPENQGKLKIDYAGQFQLTSRDTGSGISGEDTTAEFNFRRNRIKLIGAWGRNLGIYVQTEFLADRNIAPLAVTDGDSSQFQLLDAQVRVKFSDAVQVRFGRLKYNLTRENLEPCFGPLTLDRSLFIRAPLTDLGTRDQGVALWGNLMSDKLQYRLDVMNGRNDSISAPASNLRYSLRTHVTLFDPEKNYGYKGTYLGKKKVLTVGAAVQKEPEVVYGDVTGQTDVKDYMAWTTDLFLEFPIGGGGSVTASAAYVDYDLDEAYKSADPDPDAVNLNGEKNGGYLKLAFMPGGSVYQYFVRAEKWEFANLNGAFDQELNWLGAGLNWYFNDQNMKLTFEYSTTDFDKEGTFDTNVTDFSTMVAQAQIMF